MSLIIATLLAMLVPIPLVTGWSTTSATVSFITGLGHAYTHMLKTKPLLTKSTTAAIISGISDAVAQRIEANTQKAASQGTASDNNKTITSSKSTPRHNWIRSKHVLLTGFLWSGPSATYWYDSLEGFLSHFHVIQRVQQMILPTLIQSDQTIHRSRLVIGLILRLLLDSLIFSPSTVAGYLTVRTLLSELEAEDEATRAANTTSTTTAIEKCAAVTLAIRKKLAVAWKPVVLSAWRFWPFVNVLSFAFVPVEFRVLYANIMSFFWTGYLSLVNQRKAMQLLQEQQGKKNP